MDYSRDEKEDIIEIKERSGIKYSFRKIKEGTRDDASCT